MNLSWVFNPIDWVASKMSNNSGKIKTNKDLRERIEKLSGSVKPVLRDAEIDDAQLLALTRQDLNELLPGNQNFQLRRKIMEMISDAAQDPPRPCARTLVNALRDLIQRNDRGGPGAERVVREYLHAFRDLEKQFTDALDFVKPHIELLNNLSSHVPMQEEASVFEKTFSNRPSESGNKALMHAASHSAPCSLAVKIYSFASGNTLGAHEEILRHLQIQRSSLEDCRVILVFCPIVTRAGADIEGAIQKIPVSKPTILVVMHHTLNQDYVGVNPRSSLSNEIIECVNVVFHESLPGLLISCNANKQAIAQIQSTLQQFR